MAVKFCRGRCAPSIRRSFWADRFLGDKSEGRTCMTYSGPMPSVTEETEGFFAAAKQGIFALHRCTHCRTWYWPASACRHCHNEPFLANMRWEAASGRGELFSVVVPRRTFHPAFPAP